MPVPTKETDVNPLLADLRWVEAPLPLERQTMLPPVRWEPLDIGPIPRAQRLRRWAADLLEVVGARMILLSDRVRYDR